MSLLPPHRSIGIRALNRLGAAANTIGVDWPCLRADDLLSTARRRVGYDDFGGTGFKEGMAVLLDALQREAALTTLGRLSIRQTLMGYLENRLRLQRYREAHPELDEQRVERPVFIVGLPRTGTTILFNLLSQDPRNRAPLSWEVRWPVPPPESATYHRDPRIAETVRLIARFDRLAPAFAAIHEIGARLPQECSSIMAHEFLSVQFHTISNVPSYQAWLERQDLLSAYTFHKRFLQHLQSKHMKDRWVLKSPFHLAAIDRLIEVYPDARIIHTHRDPAQAVPSTASMIHTLRAISSNSLEPARIGRQVMDVWTLALERATESRRRHEDKPDQFFDAHFDDTLKDPVALLRRAYERFEIPYTDETRAQMTAFLANNPRGSRGVHDYALKDFRIELGQIHERFGDYCRVFDVPVAD